MDETRQGGDEQLDEQLAFKDLETDISDTTAPTHKSNSISPDFLCLTHQVFFSPPNIKTVSYVSFTSHKVCMSVSRTRILELRNLGTE